MGRGKKAADAKAVLFKRPHGVKPGTFGKMLSILQREYLALYQKRGTPPKLTVEDKLYITLSAQISWSHNTALLDKVKDTGQRAWSAIKAIEDGWTLNALEYQIEYRLYERQVLAEKTSNFNKRLPDPQCKLAEQTMKDPYIFDFIDLHQGMMEREIENELVKNITRLYCWNLAQASPLSEINIILRSKTRIFILISCFTTSNFIATW
jgi:hypothetical protein